jgi:hypothetical protein
VDIQAELVPGDACLQQHQLMKCASELSLTQRSLVLQAYGCQDGCLQLRWFEHIGCIPCTTQASLNKCDVHL